MQLMKRVGTLLLAVLFMLVQGASATVQAETVLPPSVVINEIQTNGTGSGTTLEEFIELKNISNSTVDISGWKIEYVTSANKVSEVFVFSANTFLEPNEQLVFVSGASQPAYLPLVAPKVVYVEPSGGIAASGGILKLMNQISIVVDVVAWTNTSSKATADTFYYTGDGKSIQRKVAEGRVVFSGVVENDFEKLAVPTPESGKIAQVPEPEDPPDDPDEPPIELPVEEPIEEPIPEENIEQPPVESPVPQVIARILLNELYIDPTTPETDANDEYVELYNPNDFEVDLKDYEIFTGTSFSYSYKFAASTKLGAKAYLVVTSGQSSLTLSNGGGAAKIQAPDSTVIEETTYTDAPAGQAWAKNSSGIWEWTASPTKEAENTITAPLLPALKVAAAKAKKATTKKATTVKAATTKKAKAKTASKYPVDDAALIAAPTPLPWWLLAVLLTLALLYVGYEYRFEFANSFYRLRNYRNNRR